MFRSDDPVADFNRRDAEIIREREQLPECEDCGEPIEDGYLYDIDGELLCEDCVVKRYRRRTSYYMEG